MSTLSPQYPKKLVPKHREIMHRLQLGQPRVAIAGAMGLSVVRLNQIIASPLFQLEYRKMCAQNETQYVELEDQFLKVAKQAVGLNGDILGNPKDALGNDIYPIGLRVDVAKTMTVLASKLISGPGRASAEVAIARASEEGERESDSDDGSYEERIQKLTLEQQVTKRLPGRPRTKGLGGRGETPDDSAIAIANADNGHEREESGELDADLRRMLFGREDELGVPDDQTSERELLFGPDVSEGDEPDLRANRELLALPR